MSTQTVSNSPKLTINTTGSHWHKETNLLLLIVLILNLPLFFDGSTANWAFSEETINGKWWQLLTHPFVHVSWYHLLLDATALFTLYPGLTESRRSVRLGYLAATATGSLMMAIWRSPEIVSIGFCGLSGVAHGILFIWSIELIEKKNQQPWIRKIGILSLSTVLIKCLWEAAINMPLVGFMHFDLMGTPILACHLGGVSGGIVALGLKKLLDNHGKKSRKSGIEIEA